MKQKKKTKKSKRKEIILLLCSIIFSLFLGELVLRVLDPYIYKNGFLLNDPYLYWKLNPAINPPSQGFKEASIDFKKLNESQLIYAIGDSFSYGIVPLNENYLTLVDNNLSNFEVINLGTPCYGTNQYYKMLVKYSKIKKPRYVFLNFFAGNDFIDSNGNVNIIVVNGGLWPPEELSKNPIVKYFLAIVLRNSYLLKDIYGLFHQDFYTRMPSQENINQELPNFSEEEYLKIEQGRMLISLKEGLDGLDTNKAEQEIERIINYCQKENISLIVIILPDEYQANAALRRDIFLTYNLPEEAFDLDKPQKMLKDILDKENINYIDLLPNFSEEPNHTVLYRPRDSHWNTAGNQLAAKIILEQLKEISPDFNQSGHLSNVFLSEFNKSSYQKKIFKHRLSYILSWFE